VLLDEIKKGEGKRLELKEKLPTNESIAKTVIAFSNTSGGKLIIGINDNKEIVGVDEDRIFKYEERISSVINDSCYPTILPEIYAQNINGKVVLIIEIFRGSMLPYFLKKRGKLKGTYVRVGSTNRIADEVMIAELQRQRLNRGFDEEENFEFNLQKTDLKTIYKEFEKIGKTCDYKKLKNLKLIKNINGKDLPTNALLITLGIFDNTVIKCARFRGTTKEIFIDKKEFSNDLFSNLKNTLKFLQNHLNINAEIKKLQLEEELEIPLLALREVLMNAIIHRDYLRNSDIKVAVYDDIVEVTSPGGFPNGLTLEEVMSGRSEIRNRVLANLFKELRYIETWGSGIGKVESLCQKKNIKFEISESGNFVSIIFNRPQIDIKLLNGIKKISDSAEKTPNNAEKTPNSAEKLLTLIKNEQEEKIVKFIIKSKKIKVKQAEKLLNLKESRTREILRNLVKRGILEKVGKTKGSYYILKG